MIKSYSELVKLKTFDERIAYLKLPLGTVGEDTFGHMRYLNQLFYKSEEWRMCRDEILARDFGYDMGLVDEERFARNRIQGMILVHHINPITAEDIINHSEKLFDPENLISVSLDTHNYIHYGKKKKEVKLAERRPNDQAPWLH